MTVYKHGLSLTFFSNKLHDSLTTHLHIFLQISQQYKWIFQESSLTDKKNSCRSFLFLDLPYLMPRSILHIFIPFIPIQTIIRKPTTLTQVPVHKAIGPLMSLFHDLCQLSRYNMWHILNKNNNKKQYT